MSPLESRAGNQPPVVVSLWLFSSPLPVPPCQSFIVYIFPLLSDELPSRNVISKQDLASVYLFFHCRSSKFAVRPTSLACLCWVFLGFQGTRAGIDLWYFSPLWLSGMPPYITSVFSPDFSGLRHKIEGNRQGVHPFLLSHFCLGPTLFLKHNCFFQLENVILVIGLLSI